MDAVSWNHSTTSQQELVQSMDSMLEMNAKFGLDSAPSVWIGFFSRFYNLENQHDGLHFCHLLRKMEGVGSNLRPDHYSFSAIVFGLATNKGIGMKEVVINLVLNDIMPRNAVPNEDLRTYTKLAVFWTIGRKIPLREQDHQLCGSYEAMSLVITAEARDEIYRVLFNHQKSEGDGLSRSQKAMG